MKDILKKFTEHELAVIFETANFALADADIFMDVAENLDLGDFEMTEIQVKLHEYMNEFNCVSKS